MQVALAKLLRSGPSILSIPRAASIGHLREDLTAALQLPIEAIAALDGIGGYPVVRS